LLPLEARATATTYSVNSSGDTTTCTRFVCTFRGAILRANSNPGVDTIAFDLPLTPLIQPSSQLPVITEGVIIDGTTQSDGYVELRGTSAGAGVDGLQITGGTGSVIRGLVIDGFSGNGILISAGSSGGNLVEGCFIGTNPAGTSAAANGDGIEVTGADHTIGGTGSPALAAGHGH